MTLSLHTSKNYLKIFLPIRRFDHGGNSFSHLPNYRLLCLITQYRLEVAIFCNKIGIQGVEKAYSVIPELLEEVKIVKTKVYYLL